MLPFRNSPKDLDPSYKRDPFLGLFWKEKKSVLYPKKYGTNRKDSDQTDCVDTHTDLIFSDCTCFKILFSNHFFLRCISFTCEFSHKTVDLHYLTDLSKARDVKITF